MKRKNEAERNTTPSSDLSLFHIYFSISRAGPWVPDTSDEGVWNCPRSKSAITPRKRFISVFNAEGISLILKATGFRDQGMKI